MEKRPVQAAGSLPREQRNRRGPLSDAERSTFLNLVAEGATVRAASYAILRAPSTMSDLINHDPAFGAAFERAYEMSADLLEEEAWRRATTADANGRYSDRLLELLLKARRPWRYRTSSQLEVTGSGGGPVRAVVGVVDARAVIEVLADAGLVAPELPTPE